MLTALLVLSLSSAWFTNPDECSVRVRTSEGDLNSFHLLDKDCEVANEWEVVYPCSASCSDFGIELLQRSVVSWETGAGKPCAFSDRFKIQHCMPSNHSGCPERLDPVCVWTEWGNPVFACTADGNGTITSTRRLLRGEQGCNETETTTHPCPVGQVYYPFTEAREKPVEEVTATEATVCWGLDCVTIPGDFRATDCEVSAWSSWSNCTAPCALEPGKGGFRYRTRHIETIPRNGGESCPSLYEEEECNYNLVCDNSNRVSPALLPSKQAGYSTHARTVLASYAAECSSIQIASHVLC